MSQDAWARPHLDAAGEDAFLMYVVFGRSTPSSPLSREKYRSAGPPGDVEVWRLDAVREPEKISKYRDGWGWSWRQLQREQPELARGVDEARFCHVVQGSVPDPGDLRYLRDAVGLVMYLLDADGVAVYDVQCMQWWSPAHWREELFDPDEPNPHRHVQTFFTNDDSGRGRWFHTRGMRKFGRPDVSVGNVPEERDEQVVDLVHRLVRLQALGGRVPDGQAIRMHGLPDGLVCVHAGDPDDPEFNNRHLRIDWPVAT